MSRNVAVGVVLVLAMCHDKVVVAPANPGALMAVGPVFLAIFRNKCTLESTRRRNAL